VQKLVYNEYAPWKKSPWGAHFRALKTKRHPAQSVQLIALQVLSVVVLYWQPLKQVSGCVKFWSSLCQVIVIVYKFIYDGNVVYTEISNALGIVSCLCIFCVCAQICWK